MDFNFKTFHYGKLGHTVHVPYHSLVVGKIKEFICDNAFISY
jgi:hypothetical protein